ncbi:hypothetical protein IHE31_09005 [Mycetohabitans rhizoxinica]|uniref:Uncharacterized protein n=1 Tax=Mycetohabitans rhizoxinica TaxID=412963 RepID=A0ABZ2PWP2_9BURK|nr:hypothetical protein [Mycetohabitans sp. B2]MCF7695616.1 hypothetical protein [Mycetohabitans sp. B2]
MNTPYVNRMPIGAVGGMSRNGEQCPMPVRRPIFYRIVAQRNPGPFP